MKVNHDAHKGNLGKLPEMAPLANPYVPFQLQSPPRYELSTGIIRGTIFPGLDLPLKGIVNQCQLPETPKAKLQILAFAIQELALYLDTHPEDREALELYRKYQKLYDRAAAEYSQNCAPMTHMTAVDHPEYTWMNDPWPWEYAANKEG